MRVFFKSIIETTIMKKLKSLSTVIIVLISVFTFQSCNDDNMDLIKMDNQTFVTKASSNNSYEIAAAILAISKSDSQLVKDYGNHMKKYLIFIHIGF